MRGDSVLTARTVLRGLSVLLAVGLFNVESLKALGATGPEIARRALPSVGLLLMTDTSGRPVSLGSAFFIAPDVAVTNAHVIAGSAGGFLRTVGSSTRYELAGYLGVDAEHDLALIRVVGPPRPALTIESEQLPEIGQSVFALGNPQGLEGTFSTGVVSGVRRFGDGSLIQITAPISPGSSGGPVLNEAGRVIGVAVGTFTGGQNLNFCIPATFVSRLVSANAALMPLSGAPRRTVTTLEQEIGNPGLGNITSPRWQWSSSYNEYFDGNMRDEMMVAVRNGLSIPITGLRFIVILYDESGREQIDYCDTTCRGVIQPGLVTWCEAGVRHASRQLLRKRGSDGRVTDGGRMSFRALDFIMVAP